MIAPSTVGFSSRQSAPLLGHRDEVGAEEDAGDAVERKQRFGERRLPRSLGAANVERAGGP